MLLSVINAKTATPGCGSPRDGRIPLGWREGFRQPILSVDEKSQIQALDREQPVLSMMPGIPERRTHSYLRHGTTSLLAALDIASGFVIGKCYKRHRATEFLDFQADRPGGT